MWSLICAMVGLGCAMVGAVLGFFMATLLSVAKQADELGESTWLQDYLNFEKNLDNKK